MLTISLCISDNSERNGVAIVMSDLKENSAIFRIYAPTSNVDDCDKDKLQKIAELQLQHFFREVTWL